MRVTVNISVNFSVGMLTHNVLAPPAIPSPTPMPSMEMMATQFWPPGFAVGQNKLTTTVKHHYMSIMQDGHDCGMLIPDLTPPMPANLYYAVMYPFSSRKVTFAASTVKMNGTAVGCAQTIGLPPLPMMTCGDPISAPTAIVHPSQALNNVTVGMTFGDFMMGLLNIALSVAIDFLFEYGFRFRAGGDALRQAFTATAGAAASQTVRQMVRAVSGRAVAREIAGKLFANSWRSVGKQAAGAAAGFLTSALGGNPTLKPSLGGPFGGLAPQYSTTTGFSFGEPDPAPAPAGGSSTSTPPTVPSGPVIQGDNFGGAGGMMP